MLVALSPDRVALLLFIGLIAWAAYSDGISLRIPNAIPVGLALLYPVHVIASPVAVDWIGALLVAVVLFAAGLALFARGFVGGGDVKLLSAAALWAGPGLGPAFLMVMAVVGGLIASVVLALSHLRRGRDVEIPGGAISGIVAAPAEAVPCNVGIAAGAASVGLRLYVRLYGGLIAIFIFVLSHLSGRPRLETPGGATSGIVEAPAGSVPYGIAIAAGAAYVGLHLFGNLA